MPDWDNETPEGKHNIPEYQQATFCAIFGQREPDFESTTDPASDTPLRPLLCMPWSITALRR